MSKSIVQIEMDFARAKKQAAELDRIAKELESLANQSMSECMSNIGSNWTGENANTYLAKCEKLKTKILNSSKQVKAAAGKVRTIANNTYQAEMAAAAVARAGR